MEIIIYICRYIFYLLFLDAVEREQCHASMCKEEVLLNMKPVKLITNTGEGALLRRRCVKRFLSYETSSAINNISTYVYLMENGSVDSGSSDKVKP